MNILVEQEAGTRLLRDSVGAVVPRDGNLSRIRSLRFAEPGHDPAVLARMAELGWIGLIVPEERGGVGMGVAELCALAEELGAGLVPEPLIACATIAPLLPDEWLDAVLAGRSVIVPAWQEAVGRIDLAGSTVAAGGRVSGRKRFVAAAGVADAFLVTTAQGLALVPNGQQEVSVELIGTQDGGFLGEVSFADAKATMIEGSFDEAFDYGALATASYLFGTMSRMLELGLDYLKTREQFGKPIGSFQVLQHRAVDLKIQLELSRAVLGEAMSVPQSGADPKARSSIVSRAKARVSDTAMLTAREVTQFHGAIGITDELDLSLFTRKVLTLYNSYGSSAAHRARYAALNFPESEKP